MKLVLLPGMDGTGDLFSSLSLELTFIDSIVIPFVQTGEQDYLTLTNYVKGKLPNQDFILLAESFSGPIAANLAKESIPTLRAVIFVATFLSPPNKFLLALSRFLPIKFLVKLPASDFFQQLLFFDNSASIKLLHDFQKVLSKLPTKTLKRRLRAMQSLTLVDSSIEIPAAYILAKSDKLVSPSKALEFEQFFNKLVIKKIAGPHFILQTKPKESALVISQLIDCMMKPS